MKKIVIFISVTWIIGIAKAQDNPVYSLDMTTSYTKNMIKVFELIKEDKFEKAYQTLKKIEETSKKDSVKHAPNRTIEQALHPLPEIAKSMLLTAPQKTAIKEERPNNDYKKAYQLLKSVVNLNDANFDDVNQFFSKNKIDYQWKDIVDNCEKWVYDKTVSTNTELGYDEALAFLMQNSSYRSDIALRRENLVFNNLMNEPTIEGCNTFLKKYSPTLVDGRYKRVIHIRDSIAYSNTTNSAASMSAFLEKYNESEFSDDAQKRLARYSFEELDNDILSYKGYINNFGETKYGRSYAKMAQDSIYKIAFRDAVNSGSIEGYTSYVKEYPKSEFFTMAQDSLYKIAFRDAVISGSIEGYISYVNEYPKSTFYNQALDSIRNLILEKYICIGANEIPESIYVEDINVVPQNIQIFHESYNNNLNSLKYYGIHRGRVSFIEEKTILPDGNEYTTTYKFSKKGLLLEERNSRNGVTKYEYDVIKGKGLYLKTISSKAGTINCSPTFSETGQLVQLEKSNGEFEKYEYLNKNTTQVSKRLYYASKKSQTPKLVEYYENGVLVRSSNTEYEHNYHGDVSYLRKISGESSSYEYQYDNGNWIRCSQTRNGYSIIKYRDITMYPEDNEISVNKNNVQNQNNRGSKAMIDETDEDEIFHDVEKMPEFPGGQEALLAYLKKNAKYPASAHIDNVEGRVIVEFVVDKDGSINKPRVIKSLNYDCDIEALRVIKSMPKWNPGKQHGKAVRVKFTCPIMYRST